MSGQYSDLQPAVAPDGSHLVFASFRPSGPTAPGVAPVKTEGLWRVDRKGTRWGEPARLPATVNLSSRVFKPSIAADGSLYFMAMDPAKQKFRLYRSQWRDGSYQPAVPLPFSDGSASDVDPEIAPDESFLLFSSAGRRPGNDNEHLFIVPRTVSGWGQVTPIRYSGDEQAVDDGEAHLGTDRTTLYFNSGRVVARGGPRTRAEASRDLERLNLWDNGNTNVWTLSLAPWLPSAGGTGPTTQRAN